MSKWNGALAALLALCLPWGTAAAEPPRIDSADWLNAMTELVEHTGIRESFTPGEQQAVDYLAGVWEKQGYRQADRTLVCQNIPSTPELIKATGWDGGVTNVIAIQKAVNDNPGVIIVCAHFDSFYNTVGAKDNASGMAAVLTLSDAFRAAEPYQDTELRFIAFAGEEFGEIGSTGYVDRLTTAESARIQAVFNLDILAVEEGAVDVALCCNTLGGRDGDGSYLAGNDDEPASNRASLAFAQAFWEWGGFTEKQQNIDFCIPQHWGGGDHVPFHNAFIDAATICFQGNFTVGGLWPDDMHTPNDDLNKRFDLPRTQHALDVLCQAIDELAMNHGYGGEGEEE